MSILSEIFSWWGGNTWGTRFTLWRTAEQVGEDEFGNRYFEQRNGVGPLGRPRRFVIYRDLAEPSKVPATWHGWLHYTVDERPTEESYRRRSWQKPHKMNMTGTRLAYRPPGSILRPQKQGKVKASYSAWKPD